ncbi:hypothetical protein GN244_ATG08425 [Phytophthora infestans]|uniref:Uncharacterized protein n=1 Tax=Phytophthora infestans TaxID=4787 RepID=A0A833T4N3_PHYIN|nr:hypothetical protein GN244_ATG08425 [Phytophthora infestans]
MDAYKVGEDSARQLARGNPERVSAAVISDHQSKQESRSLALRAPLCTGNCGQVIPRDKDLMYDILRMGCGGETIARMECSFTNTKLERALWQSSG